jgi:uncharacterized protein (TIGR02001 family)
MNKLVLSVVAAATMCSGAAIAADMPVKARPVPAAVASPWDWAFGGALMSDYNFRGISQSNRGPSVTAYSETRFNVNPAFQFYAGSQYWAVTLPTDPTAEVDFYGGLRITQGPVVFDLGAIYYWYPKEKQHNDAFFTGFGGCCAPFPSFPNTNATLKDTDYWEVYGKLTWDVLKDKFALGANVYYSPSWLNTGADGLFASVTAKVTMPTFQPRIFWFDEVGWFISGEFGYYWLGDADPYPNVFPPTALNLPDYATWNVGLAFTWKVATLDLRYYDTNLSKEECSFLTSDPNATAGPNGTQSKWCSAAFIAALKFDLTMSANLK